MAAVFSKAKAPATWIERPTAYELIVNLTAAAQMRRRSPGTTSQIAPGPIIAAALKAVGLVQS
jgi:hypothetical protein